MTEPRIASEAVAGSLERLRGAVRPNDELGAALQAVVDATCTIFRADGAGIMVIDEQQALHHVGATDGRAAALEAAQEEAGEGPCVDSLIHDQVVWTTDLQNDPRWPQLSEAIGPLPIRGILGVPIHVGGVAVGSLNTYRSEPYEWDRSEVDAIEAHGRVVEEVLGLGMLARDRHVLVEQLTRALENRVTIERAVGVVMASDDLDPVRAFDLLRRKARAERRKVSDIAEEVLEQRRFSPPAQPPPDGRGPT